jgi:DNA polymerase-3 subunit alpha
MGKKKASEMEKQRENFLKGATEKGVKPKVAEQIFAEIEPFAGYAFNGAHAACYAMVAYQTAYLKANYPAEYLAALMGAYIENTEKVVATIEECGRLAVQVLPPDVNESAADFTVHAPTEEQYVGAVRFGLAAIKNVGKAPVEAILAARDKGGRFLSLEDFCTRVFQEGVTSRSVIEMLIKAGALASLSPNRRALLEALDDCVAAASRGAKDAAAGLISLWGDAPIEDAAAVQAVASLPDITDFARGELLAMEKELLGLYLSEHPLKPFEPEIRRKYKAMRADLLKETQPNQEVIVGGLVTAVRTHFSKTGQPMLFVTLEDTTGSLSATCFPKTTSEYGKFVMKDAVVVFKGKAQHRERFGKNNGGAAGEGEGEERNVQVELIVDRVDQIVPNAMAADARPREVHVRIDSSARTLLRMLKETLSVSEGGSPLFLHVDTGGVEYKIKSKLLIAPEESLISQVRQMLGGGPRRAWVE